MRVFISDDIANVSDIESDDELEGSTETNKNKNTIDHPLADRNVKIGEEENRENDETGSCKNSSDSLNGAPTGITEPLKEEETTKANASEDDCNAVVKTAKNEAEEKKIIPRDDLKDEESSQAKRDWKYSTEKKDEVSTTKYGR